jgi:signal transduction histidine kinase
MANKIEFLPFEARARTVDHLGREQIADSPTAISELWKNAYDAYATYVSMHISGSPTPVVGIFDNGHGMTRQEFVDRWLVLGTETKLTTKEIPEDRLGLPTRARQGQKGIGRLSVAFLGPLVLVISKRQGQPFVASAVDWRVFENPFLMLADVVTPVATFNTPVEFENARVQLLEGVASNAWPKPTDERNARLLEAWTAYDAYENERGIEPLTSSRIVNAALHLADPPALLENWQVWSGGADHGTALLVFEPKPELLVWVDPSITGNTDESMGIQENFISTLTGFVDPLSREPILFEYEVVAHRDHGSLVILSAEDQFGRDEFDRLEHAIEGRFDRRGAFGGSVRAFGRVTPNVSFPPPPDFANRSRVGAFEFAIGTFEQEEPFSTHTPEEHVSLREATRKQGGLRVYRDGLRVMPYGRPANDFFELEARRSLHAGREFWQHRRVFGRVGLGSAENPNLRDKAGREGLIDNSSRRELKQLVVHLLRSAARMYFGTDAPSREEDLARVRAAKIAAKEARQTVSRSINKRLLHHIREHTAELVDAMDAGRNLRSLLEEAESVEQLTSLHGKLDDLHTIARKLRLPPRAGKLTAANEEKYLEFRGSHRELLTGLNELKLELDERIESGDASAAARTAESHLSRRRGDLITALNSFEREIKQQLGTERDRIATAVAKDRSRVLDAIAVLTESTARIGSLALIDETFETLSDRTLPYYEHYLGVVERLTEGMDLFLALIGTLNETSELESRVTELNALAQMGITVEIVGHEMERLDQEVRTQLARLPPAARASIEFQRAALAYDTLVNRLKFLAPLKISTSRIRERITGADISAYIEDFYGDRFQTDRVDVCVTDDFRDIILFDYRHRLYPVFINLINNALYWLQFAAERKVVVGLHADDIVIADSGPGVDPDDIESLFGLFFTRRLGGRGIGLYLAKANLGASGHMISYRSGGPLLKGANFVITPRELVRGHSTPVGT